MIAFSEKRLYVIHPKINNGSIAMHSGSKSGLAIASLVLGIIICVSCKKESQSAQTPEEGQAVADPVPEAQPMSKKDRFAAIRKQTQAIIDRSESAPSAGEANDFDAQLDESASPSSGEGFFDGETGIVKEKYVDPEKIDKTERSITTTAGETYQGVIVNVGPKGIDIAHANGVGLIPYKDLPLDVKKEFYEGSK